MHPGGTMRFIIEVVLLFWLAIYTIGWLWYYHDLAINPLSYGIMELVLLALIAGWIEKCAEIREILDDLPD
jgi:hypothetical protein